MSCFADRVISRFDTALRTVAGVHRSARPSPGRAIPEADLAPVARADAAALMRVNHVGEICAQALYQGQALTARSTHLPPVLDEAAREEEDHLAWCSERIRELGGRTSALAPVWYAGSFMLGALAGAAGDRWNLGFLAETERQVEAHLDGHLERLSPQDLRTRAVVQQMRVDEGRHRATAQRLGGADLPDPVRGAMRAAAKVMTTVAYRI